MKRIVAILLSFIMLLAMLACSKDNAKDSAKEAESTTPAIDTAAKEVTEVPFSIVGNPDAVESISRSVIQLICYDEFGNEYATGSGFFSFDPGIVVTNYHVIEGNVNSVKGITEEQEFPIDWIVCYNESYDLAILQADPNVLAEKKIDATPLPIGDSSALRVSEHVTAIGVPLGISKTVSDGIISGFYDDNGMQLIQFTAPISPGSSGGALLNDKGEVVGITSASFSRGQNFNLTVPAKYIQELYNEKGSGQSLSAFLRIRSEMAVVNALAKLDELKSMHMDMSLVMDMSITIAAQGMTMNMPIKMSMGYLMDVQKDPYMTKMDVTMDMDMGAYGKQSSTALVYMDMTGEAPVGYSSTDGGATWIVESEELEEIRPQESGSVLKEYAKDFEKTGTDTVDGKAVTVYSGKLDGKYAQEIMGSTGMEELLSEIDVDDPTGEATELKDILVTVCVDDETGYPLYYSMDMTDMMKDILAAAMKKAMGMEDLEGMDVTLDVPAIKVEATLSQFDSVEPIVIPESALAAANN